MKLRDKTILITGGTSGIGKALVHQLSAANSELIVIGRNPAKLKNLKEEIGGVHTYQCPLDDTTSVKETLSEIIEIHPQLCVVINNAGIQETPELPDRNFNFDSISREINSNLAAPIWICALAVKHLLALKSDAAIINVTSGLAFFPKRESAVYCATKAGLRNFTTGFRYQLEGSNVSVHEAIIPLVDTPMTEGRGSGKISADEAARAIINGVEKNKEEIYVGKTRFLPILARVSPSLVASMMKGG